MEQHKVKRTEAIAKDIPHVDLGTSSDNFSKDESDADFDPEGGEDPDAAGLYPLGTAGYDTMVVDLFCLPSAVLVKQHLNR